MAQNREEEKGKPAIGTEGQRGEVSVREVLEGTEPLGDSVPRLQSVAVWFD